MKKRLKRIAHALGYDIQRVNQERSVDAQVVHFLHIGKNAGTQIMNIADQICKSSSSLSIKKHPHDVFLKDLPKNSRYFFSIRSPLTRFRSGFYSRKRKGQPRIYSEWTEHDAIAFSDFEHANDLAESLFESGEIGIRAFQAMKSIRHTSQNQSDWFSCAGNFLRVRPPISIIRQEKFELDMEKLIEILDPNLELEKLQLFEKDSQAHRNDYTDIPSLSPRAKENLRVWYSQDFVFYDMCNEWIERSSTK